MSDREFEKILGTHCSPALLGMKPANLVSFSKAKAPDIMEHIINYRQQLRENGVEMKIVCSCKKHYLLLVYRPDLIYAYLSKKEIHDFLMEHGYDPEATPEECIEILTKKYAENQQCPHEIGIFLGYPLEDVIGFTIHKGNDFKYCGYWKVYGDVQSAIEIFAQYKQCSRYTCEKMSQGYTLSQVIGMKKQSA